MADSLGHCKFHLVNHAKANLLAPQINFCKVIVATDPSDMLYRIGLKCKRKRYALVRLDTIQKLQKLAGQ
jgi:hypothetical protein